MLNKPEETRADSDEAGDSIGFVTDANVVGMGVGAWFDVHVTNPSGFVF